MRITLLKSAAFTGLKGQCIRNINCTVFFEIFPPQLFFRFYPSITCPMFYFQSHISRASCEGKSCNPRSGISWISSLFVKSQFQGYFQALFPEPNTKRSISRAKVKMGKAAIHGLEYPKYYLYLGNQFQRYIQVRFPFPETKSRWERLQSLV